MPLLTLIVPCLNEEACIPLFYDAIRQVHRDTALNELDLEFLYIDDGSTDQSLAKMQALAEFDPDVHYLSFSRNFGKEAAIYAGLQHAKGDYVCLMDVDLQDPPELLPKMYELLLHQDLDCVGTRRVDRSGEPKVRSFFARVFYRLMGRISQTEIVDGARDFRLMHRNMVDAILQVSEYNRFSKGIFSWVGFKTIYLPYPNRERKAGKTSWHFWQLFYYSIDGIVNFSDAPLTLITLLGVLVFVIAIMLALFYTIRTLLFGNPTSGWTSLTVIILALGGLQMLSLGVVGKYVGKTFLETKRRPIYLLREMKSAPDHSILPMQQKNKENKAHVSSRDDDCIS